MDGCTEYWAILVVVTPWYTYFVYTQSGIFQDIYLKSEPAGEVGIGKLSDDVGPPASAIAMEECGYLWTAN